MKPKHAAAAALAALSETAAVAAAATKPTVEAGIKTFGGTWHVVTARP
jgi:hypothetical protein